MNEMQTGIGISWIFFEQSTEWEKFESQVFW